MGTNKLPSSANNVGKGKVMPVDLEQRTSRKTLVYQVTVKTGVNVSKADESNINENATGDSAVTWIKPLEESTEPTASYDINKEQSADRKRLAHTPEEKLTKTEMVSSHQIKSPPSVSPTSTDVSTQSAVTKTSVTQVSRITSRLNNGRDITINEMSLVDKSASDAARNQTATNSSILPEQLEQFQSMLVQIMEDDEDFLNADKEQVRAVLLEQTQFPYLAGTVQAGSSSSCTLYNITCQPPVPLRANCTGISPVVCVDPPGKAGRDRSGVFHLVLQLLVGACVLFMPLIWIICRKQPNEVVANGNI
ncbi:hypothetical protein FJT64_019221 [Amphibalanus amphitrite]|uniref:Uncharacterized protein n=1 Tax=Amphibalanus amphitrite TaxID=1232801 RepID=A0A6A4WSD5_AMPAM|nr:hypothetical protein FJT64_019221 [Amphibalanus amphitrite]